MDSRKLSYHTRRFASRFVPASMLQAQLHRHTIMQFADRIGLVYFGYVDQRHDEHSLVRGVTLSPTHRDNNYCVGTYEGYDITLVERSDTIKLPNRAAKPYQWMIMTVDLHALVDLPHVFIGLHTGDETFYANVFTKFSRLAMVPLGTLGLHDQSFLRRYTVYSPAEQALSAERLLRPEITKVIAEQFGNMMIEINEGTLYFYGENYRPTAHLLERMLKLGIWMAQTLDVQAKNI